jgi:hypothetical protein
MNQFNRIPSIVQIWIAEFLAVMFFGRLGSMPDRPPTAY